MLDLLGAGRNDVGRIVGDTPKLKKKNILMTVTGVILPMVSLVIIRSFGIVHTKL